MKRAYGSQWVRLREAGSPEAEKIRLSDIGIDLPGVDDEGRQIESIVNHIIQQGESTGRSGNKRRNMVLVGGPGQGKSTIVQLVCQAYRMAILTDRPEVNISQISEMKERLLDRFIKIGVSLPQHRRWPISIRLSDFAEEIGPSGEADLLRYMCGVLEKATTRRILPTLLKDWLKEWPWLVVLDGLDEVAAMSVREAVEQKVDEFLIDVADFDVLVVATTRPQGYNDEFSTEQFRHISLRRLSSREALQYGQELATIRHHDDEDTYESVIAGLKIASSNPNTSKLMETPLQVTIMAILVERRVRVPESRFKLFEEYYRTIYDREISKVGPTARLLEEYRKEVDYLHQAVAIRLHLRSEDALEAQLLHKDELESLAFDRLRSKEVEAIEARSLAKKIVDASTTRLVLLAPIARDHVGFDVRSLQEFMAAVHLTSAADSIVIKRLQMLAHISHWRNVWLFSAGRIFANIEHLCDALVGILGKMDGESELALVARPSSLLALDLLEDALAIREPKYERIFVKHALDNLIRPPSPDTVRLGELMNAIANRGLNILHLMIAKVREALTSNSWIRINAILFLVCYIEVGGKNLGTSRTLLQATLAGLSANETLALGLLEKKFHIDTFGRYQDKCMVNGSDVENLLDFLSAAIVDLQRDIVDSHARAVNVELSRRVQLFRAELARMSGGSNGRRSNEVSIGNSLAAATRRIVHFGGGDDMQGKIDIALHLHAMCHQVDSAAWDIATALHGAVVELVARARPDEPTALLGSPTNT